VISRAKNVQRMLAARGLKGRKVPDLIIAAAAELAGLTVLHYDHDFELIASVTGQPHEWVVPRGSIDLRGKCRIRQASLRRAPAGGVLRRRGRPACDPGQAAGGAVP